MLYIVDITSDDTVFIFWFPSGEVNTILPLTLPSGKISIKSLIPAGTSKSMYLFPYFTPPVVMHIEYPTFEMLYSNPIFFKILEIFS